MNRTYLDQCLKEDLLVRWPDRAMPINVFIAPFTWYEKSKQASADAYRQMVMEALDTWSRVSGGLVKFRLVPKLNDPTYPSQLNFAWRRVDRKSLGHCEFAYDNQARMYSAEIQIGISDGILHAKYNDPNEVKHTILHEIGHALGLVGHSDHPDDIMYVPHQYGVVNISPRDVETLQWLYKLPVGFNYKAVAEKYSLDHPFTFHDVLGCIAGDKKPKSFLATAKAKQAKKRPERPEVLNKHHDILSQQGRFWLNTQNINVPQDLKQRLKQERFRPPED